MAEANTATLNLDAIREFYGEAAFSRIRSMEKASAAIRQFGMAERSENEGVQKRALEMAAKNELEAFAGA